jgi:hypothetical protein
MSPNKGPRQFSLVLDDPSGKLFFEIDYDVLASRIGMGFVHCWCPTRTALTHVAIPVGEMAMFRQSQRIGHRRQCMHGGTHFLIVMGWA